MMNAALTDREVREILDRRDNLEEVVRTISEGGCTDPVKYAKKVIKELDKADDRDD